MPGMKDSISIVRGVNYKQKVLLLCNLRELYCFFKARYSDICIGFSSFCALRPKHCIFAGSSGTHSVCVCVIHQNAKLLASNLDITYNELLNKIVCDPTNRECMIHRCGSCPGTGALYTYLYDFFEEFNDATQIEYKQWQSTDRTTLITQTTSVQEYIDLVVHSFDKLTVHSYVTKAQSNYLKTVKEQIRNDTIIILLDFSENYKYVVQDEVQGYHWNNPQCTLHPIVIYHKIDEKLLHKSFCVLSDDLNHDICMVYRIQCIFTSYLKSFFPNIIKVHYFSDGCGAQYKNKYNFYNICQHEKDFGLKAQWSFFATAHGKSPCDGIAGTVKRAASKASLQCIDTNHILDLHGLFNFCQENFTNIKFFKITNDEMEFTRKSLNTR